MEEKKYLKAHEMILKADHILLVTHDRPDGDALSSLCAMLEFLIRMNKKVFAFCRDVPPYQFSFLPHIEKIKSDKKEFDFSDFDLIIVLDCGGLNRTNLAEEITHKNENQQIIEFDHHPKIDSYATLELREPAFSSTAEVIYRFFKANQLKINKITANCILTGILTDTANFFHNSTKDTTIKIASELLLLGARFPVILENTWRNKSLAAMKLWGEAISNLQVNEKYGLAFALLPFDTLKDSGVTDEELEGLSGFLSNLHGVKGLLLLREEEENRLKGSLRTSHPEVDISRLAQFLGGGGHAKASGFVFRSSLKKSGNKYEVI